MQPRKLQIIETSQQPFSSGFQLPPPPTTVPPSGSSGVHAGVLAGAGASLAVVLVLVAGVIWFARRRRSRAPVVVSKASATDQNVCSLWRPLCLCMCWHPPACFIKLHRKLPAES
jgi:hypothetical protein